MPVAASALYSRWWQLETWLRSLVYLELRSAKGPAWTSALPAGSASCQQKDDDIRYMRTPDAQDQLAYLDASLLLQLTLDQWPLFGSYRGRKGMGRPNRGTQGDSKSHRPLSPTP